MAVDKSQARKQHSAVFFLLGIPFLPGNIISNEFLIPVPSLSYPVFPLLPAITRSANRMGGSEGVDTKNGK